MSFIGIDIGASFIKSAILDVDSVRLKHVDRIPFPKFVRTISGERAVAASDVLAAVRHSLKKMLTLEPVCEGLLICGQMHSLVFCDSTGNPKSEINTWQDQRSVLQFDSTGNSHLNLLLDAIKDFDMHQLGNERQPGIPLAQLYYLKNSNLLPVNLYPVSLMDFVAANLCNALPITDVTNAEAHGVFNLVRGDWEYQLIEQLGLDKLLWPEIKPHFTIVGNFLHDGQKIPCFVPFGDQQCALLGSFIESTELSLNIATGSQVSLLSDQWEYGEYQTRPYFENKYLKTITHLPAGRALNSLIKLLSELGASDIPTDVIWDYIQSQVQETSKNDLDVSITFFSGPLGNEGRILHMREENMTIGHVFSAAFNNMAENYYQCALKLTSDRSWDKIVFSGGLILKAPYLRDAVLARFEDPQYRINTLKEDTLTGLLILALRVRFGHGELEEYTRIVRKSTNDGHKL